MSVDLIVLAALVVGALFMLLLSKFLKHHRMKLLVGFGVLLGIVATIGTQTYLLAPPAEKVLLAECPPDIIPAPDTRTDASPNTPQTFGERDTPTPNPQEGLVQPMVEPQEKTATPTEE